LRITELVGPVAALPRTRPPGEPLADPEILGLSCDSRSVQPGFLFAALPGTRLDGRRFAAEAVRRGAVAILTDEPEALELSAAERSRIAVVADRNPHRALALLAARFYRDQPATIAAVTGTNGKTSVAHFTREIWSRLGCPAASLGTLGLVTPARRRAGSLTTPDPVALHCNLARLAQDGIAHVAIEASSHGLAQYRLDAVRVTAAAFTNLTRDHLDYHGDIGSYRAAKERLFAELLAPDGTAVLNADSPEFPRLSTLCCGRGLRVLAYGSAESADVRLVATVPDNAGQRLTLAVLGRRREVKLPLAGAFQAMNALAALGLVVATGAAVEAATATLAHLSGVPGRLQLVAEASGAAVYVDYAHTPDALATVLTALRPHAAGRLIALFGAGGDRDPGKRPLMGEVASRLADRVYVTDDNPRSEPPDGIRRAILAAAPGAIEIGDRAAAIAAAIAELRPGDVLVVAGKGHETGQIIGSEIRPFDDVVVAREAAGRLAHARACA